MSDEERNEKPWPPDEHKMKKKCTLCKQEKPIDQFNRDKERKDGYRSYCNSCRKPIRKKYLQKLSPEQKAHKKKWNRDWYKSLSLEKIEKRRQYGRAYQKKKNQQLRQEILTAYGSCCVCCDETEPKFLCVDHIEGNGNEHRKKLGVGAGSAFYKWIKKQDFPSTLQLLCHNCNMAKGFYGECPHNEQQD